MNESNKEEAGEPVWVILTPQGKMYYVAQPVKKDEASAWMGFAAFMGWITSATADAGVSYHKSRGWRAVQATLTWAGQEQAATSLDSHHTNLSGDKSAVIY